MMSQAVLDAPPQSVSAFPADIDPVRFAVLRNALLAITEEMGATLRQAAYSTRKVWSFPQCASSKPGRLTAICCAPRKRLGGALERARSADIFCTHQR